MAWEAHKELNSQVIGDMVGIIVTILVSVILSTFSLIKDPRALILVIPISIFIIFGISADMESNTCDLDNGVEGFDIDIDFIPTEDETSDKENEYRSQLLNNLATACMTCSDPRDSLDLGIPNHYYIGGNDE